MMILPLPMPCCLHYPVLFSSGVVDNATGDITATDIRAAAGNVAFPGTATRDVAVLD